MIIPLLLLDHWNRIPKIIIFLWIIMWMMKERVEQNRWRIELKIDILSNATFIYLPFDRAWNFFLVEKILFRFIVSWNHGITQPGHCNRLDCTAMLQLFSVYWTNLAQWLTQNENPKTFLLHFVGYEEVFGGFLLN